MPKAPDLCWSSCDYDDQDSIDAGWEMMVNDLTEFMNKILPEGQWLSEVSWHCEVKNFGWQHRDGYKDFNAHTGQELLRAILPNTDCTFEIWLDEEAKEIRVNNAHHDSPSGGEIYTVTVKDEAP